MRNKSRRNYFNLIEIALAIGVIAVGLASVIGMFPIAMNTANESIGDNEVANVAETFLNNLQAQIYAEEEPDWSSATSGLLRNIPKEKNTNNAALAIGNFTPPSGDSTGDFGDWTRIGISNVYRNKNNDGNKMVFLVTTGDTEDDFVDGAIIQVWRPEISDFVIAGQELNNDTQRDTLEKFMASLMVEVSYPAAKPYSARKTRLYRLDLFNPISPL